MKGFINVIVGKAWLSRVIFTATLLLTSLTGFANDEVVENRSFPAQVALTDNGKQLTISTTSVQWQIPLERYSILGNSATKQRALHDTPCFYRGHIMGEGNSWVRINSAVELPSLFRTPLLESDISGHVFINDELFKLQHDKTTGHSLIASTDTSISIDALVSRYKFQNNDASAPSDIKSKTSPLKVIKIGMMVDSRFNDLHNGDGLNKALNILSGVDGLFQDQLGLAIVVENFKLEENPLTDHLLNFVGSMEQMLNEFRQIRQRSPELPAGLALVHLFTGHGDPNQLIGVSWIDTVCQLDGYDISISTPYENALLLSAHESVFSITALLLHEPTSKTRKNLEASRYRVVGNTD